MQALVETGDWQDTDAHCASRLKRTAQRAALRFKVFMSTLMA